MEGSSFVLIHRVSSLVLLGLTYRRTLKTGNLLPHNLHYNLIYPVFFFGRSGYTKGTYKVVRHGLFGPDERRVDLKPWDDMVSETLGPTVSST